MIEIYFNINKILLIIWILFTVISPFIPYCRNKFKKIDILEMYKNIDDYLNDKNVLIDINMLTIKYILYVIIISGFGGVLILIAGSFFILLPIIYIIFINIIKFILNLQKQTKT